MIVSLFPLWASPTLTCTAPHRTPHSRSRPWGEYAWPSKTFRGPGGYKRWHLPCMSFLSRCLWASSCSVARFRRSGHSLSSTSFSCSATLVTRTAAPCPDAAIASVDPPFGATLPATFQSHCIAQSILLRRLFQIPIPPLAPGLRACGDSPFGGGTIC